ncbi:MAG: filamentous hemagglutinin N-terminal domain-containing protein, partial [Burkholderiaceae bacterium]
MVTSDSRVFLAASRRRTLVVALAAIYGVLPQVAQANPAGASVVQGQATLQTQGNKLTVTNSPGAIINWQQFSIGTGQTTYFQQQNAASTVLNRVQTQNPALKSQIDGTLGSNGRVFLINPNGVVFGAGSVIDTQGFVASTLSLRDEDFKSGQFRFTRDGAAGDIQVQGQIRSGNGDVYLIAPHVGVDGNAVISSQGGNIVLAAGEMVEITGRNLNDITFAVQSRDNTVVNLGRLEGGAVGVFAGTLQHSGVVRAQTLSREGGRLVLKAMGDV